MSPLAVSSEPPVIDWQRSERANEQEKSVDFRRQTEMSSGKECTTLQFPPPNECQVWSGWKLSFHAIRASTKCNFTHLKVWKERINKNKCTKVSLHNTLQILSRAKWISFSHWEMSNSSSESVSNAKRKKRTGIEAGGCERKLIKVI